MSTYSVADAKNALPRLIDKAIEGDEVMISRHGKVVAEIRPVVAPAPAAAATYEWLQKRRRGRRRVAITSVRLLDEMYEAKSR